MKRKTTKSNGINSYRQKKHTVRSFLHAMFRRVVVNDEVYRFYDEVHFVDVLQPLNDP